MHTIESFEKLKSDEMRAHLAERGIKVPSKATKAVMVEAFRASITSAGQVEAPVVVMVEPDPLDRLDGFIEMRERSHEPKFDTLVLDPAPSLEPPVPPEGLEFSSVEETKKEAPMNRHQRRRAAALSDKRSMRKARALDLRG